MGARNVSACFTMWAHLDHAPFRLLVGMALQSLDHTSKEGRPARMWFGGQDSLVELVGRSRTQAYEALRKLREAGAVEVIDAGRTDHRAVYRLALDPIAASGLPGPGSVRVTRTKRVPPTGTRGSRSTGPLGTTEESTEESREGDTSPERSSHLRIVPPVDNPEMTYAEAYELLKAAWGSGDAGLRAAALIAQGRTPTQAVLELAATLTEGGKTA